MCPPGRRSSCPPARGWGNVSRMRQLLASGADPKAKSGGGSEMGTLGASIHSGKVEAVQLLLESGVDANAPANQANQVGWSPLMIALGLYSRGLGNEAVVAALLDSGADANFKNAMGPTPLQVAALYAPEPVVKALIDRGADPRLNSPGLNGVSPFGRK
ncbi:MAG: ankyrin repeat domain-containing protein [Verrucomicrobia bacterium]|nr:ankyrin repeat domain-containing protein [Verrucomicrobiota bacterium]